MPALVPASDGAARLMVDLEDGAWVPHWQPPRIRNSAWHGEPVAPGYRSQASHQLYRSQSHWGERFLSCISRDDGVFERPG